MGPERLQGKLRTLMGPRRPAAARFLPRERAQSGVALGGLLALFVPGQLEVESGRSFLS